MSKLNLSEQEHRHIAAATHAIQSIENTVHRLQREISKAEAELKELKSTSHKLIGFARQNNPFQVYQSDFFLNLQRKQALQGFVTEMSPIIPQMLAEIPQHKAKIAEIEAEAAQRANAIRLLEEELSIICPLIKGRCCLR
jgi:ABC-type uncharacterized transport system involved in gliding motility auxiliary subunit